MNTGMDWGVVLASGWHAPGEGCGLLRGSTSSLSGECSASIVWGCPHIQGVNVGSLFSQRVAACMVCCVIPGAASCCSGLGMWGVHPQRIQQVLSGGDYCLSAR